MLRLAKRTNVQGSSVQLSSSGSTSSAALETSVSSFFAEILGVKKWPSQIGSACEKCPTNKKPNAVIRTGSQSKTSSYSLYYFHDLYVIGWRALKRTEPPLGHPKLQKIAPRQHNDDSSARLGFVQT